MSLELAYYEAADPDKLYNLVKPSLGVEMTPEIKAAISANSPNRIEIRVTAILNHKVEEFLSISAAAQAINTDHRALRYCLNHKTLFKKRYIIEAIESGN